MLTFYCINIYIIIEGGPRYKPPEVSRGSPVLHCSLTTITTIVYFDMCNLINSCSSCSSGKYCLSPLVSGRCVKSNLYYRSTIASKFTLIWECICPLTVQIQGSPTLHNLNIL